MKRLLPSFCLALLTALVLPVTSAPAQSGIVLKTFPLQAGQLLLDPSRPQLYATLPNDNSLAVINTDMNTVVTTLHLGFSPAALTISADGTRLYVTNTDTTATGLGVVDLTTLTVLPNLPTPAGIVSVAAGLGNRLYLLNGGNEGFAPAYVAQVDATTGALQGTFAEKTAVTSSFSLSIAPDLETLFVNAGGITDYDVSTTTPSQLQQFPSGLYYGDPPLSHNGQFLAVSGESTTELVPATNLNGVAGTVTIGSYPGVAAFSVDDTKLYQVQASAALPYSVLKVFSTQTFTLLDSFNLFTNDSAGDDPTNITSLAATANNGYLYVAGSTGIDGTTYADLKLVSTQIAPFFNGSASLSDGFYYLQFPDGNLFGYYNFNTSPYLFHIDLGFEYPFDAADGSGGIYLYDFTSQTFFYTSASLFPYLYDFTLNSFLYYYPNTRLPGHYTAYPRYFFDFATDEIITK